jgi:hypothetical protein
MEGKGREGRKGEWVDGRKDGREGGRDERKEKAGGWMEGRMDGRIDGWLEGKGREGREGRRERKERQVGRWKEGWMDGWTDDTWNLLVLVFHPLMPPPSCPNSPVPLITSWREVIRTKWWDQGDSAQQGQSAIPLAKAPVFLFCITHLVQAPGALISHSPYESLWPSDTAAVTLLIQQTEHHPPPPTAK